MKGMTMARATQKAVSSAAKTMAAEAQRPHAKREFKPGEEWRGKPAYLLHPISRTLHFYPTHVQCVVMAMGVQGDELKPWIIQSVEDLAEVKAKHPMVWSAWVKSVHMLEDNRPSDVFIEVGRKADKPEWAWGAEATRHAEVGTRRQKTLAVREYTIDVAKCTSVASDEKVTKQVRQLAEVLKTIASPILEATLMSELKAAAEKGILVTKQDPWRIFQYYRGQLIQLGVIRMKAGA